MNKGSITGYTATVIDDRTVTVQGPRSEYELKFKSRKWSCSCPSFKHRGDCKHMDLLPEELKVKRFPRTILKDTVLSLALSGVFNSLKWEVCGSYRREALDGKDLDIVVMCTEEQFETIYDRFYTLPQFRPDSDGSHIIRGYWGDIPIDVDRVELSHREWWATVLFRTGPKDLNVRMRQKAKDMGLLLNEHGIKNLASGNYLSTADESSIFAVLGMEYIHPRNRR